MSGPPPTEGEPQRLKPPCTGCRDCYGGGGECLKYGPVPATPEGRPVMTQPAEPYSLLFTAVDTAPWVDGMVAAVARNQLLDLIDRAAAAPAAERPEDEQETRP